MRYDDERRRRRARAGGFTMIEIMVALGIILLLVGILIVGITFVGRSAKERATRVTLSNARSMFAEFDAKTRLRNQPQAWAWRGEVWAPKPAHADLSLNFYTAPYRNDTPSTDVQGYSGNDDGTLDTRDGADALDAPRTVERESPEIDRNASVAVINTQLVMSQFRAIPELRSQLEKLPTNQFMPLQWTGGTRANPGIDGVFGTGDDGASPDDIYYFVGNIVQNGGVSFKCKQRHQATSAPMKGSPDWDDEEDMTGAVRAAPILLDAWDNPIIFVPAGGIALQQGGQNLVVKSPDNRPFWASAGPDGNFQKGDDNLYSYED